MRLPPSGIFMCLMATAVPSAMLPLLHPSGLSQRPMDTSAWPPLAAPVRWCMLYTISLMFNSRSFCEQPQKHQGEGQ